MDPLTGDVNRLLRLRSDVLVSDHAMMVRRRIEGVLREKELTHVFIPYGRWEAGQGKIIARATLTQ